MMNFALTYIHDDGDNATYLYKAEEVARKDFKESFFSIVEEAGKDSAIEVQCEIKGNHWRVECLFPENDFSASFQTDCYLTPIYCNDAEAEGEEG